MNSELISRLKRQLKDAMHSDDWDMWDKISKRIDAIENGQPDPGDDELPWGCEGTE